jgi:hypothetical protein
MGSRSSTGKRKRIIIRNRNLGAGNSSRKTKAPKSDGNKTYV